MFACLLFLSFTSLVYCTCMQPSCPKEDLFTSYSRAEQIFSATIESSTFDVDKNVLVLKLTVEETFKGRALNNGSLVTAVLTCVPPTYLWVFGEGSSGNIFFSTQPAFVESQDYAVELVDCANNGLASDCDRRKLRTGYFGDCADGCHVTTKGADTLVATGASIQRSTCKKCTCLENGLLTCFDVCSPPTLPQPKPEPKPTKSCNYNGVHYGEGESVYDGCNTCSCSSGSMMCTELACAEGCHVHAGENIPNGGTYTDGCSICVCQSGDLSCTNECESHHRTSLLMPLLSAFALVFVLLFIFIIVAIRRRRQQQQAQSIQMDDVEEVEGNSGNFGSTNQFSYQPVPTSNTMMSYAGQPVMTQPMVMMTQTGEPIVVQVAYM